MDRRNFLAAFGMGPVAFGLHAIAQPSRQIPRVGYLFSFAPSQGSHLWEACRLGLRELGYVEGRNIVLEPRWAGGHHDRLPKLAAELVQMNVDVIVAAATPASRAAKAATNSIPIVIVAVGEPVKTGLVTTLARPGGNVTGLSLLTVELSGKRIELLMNLVPDIPRLGIVMNPDNPVHRIFLEETRTANKVLGARLQPLQARDRKGIEEAFIIASREQTTALVVFDDPVLWSHRNLIVDLAAGHRIPAIYGYREFVDAGGLISYGPDRIDHYRRTASYVSRILKGAKPGSLAVEQPTKFELVINLKTARALNLMIPQSIRLRADLVE